MHTYDFTVLLHRFSLQNISTNCVNILLASTVQRYYAVPVESRSLCEGPHTDETEIGSIERKKKVVVNV